jgi:hypothetical protein
MNLSHFYLHLVEKAKRTCEDAEEEGGVSQGTVEAITPELEEPQTDDRLRTSVQEVGARQSNRSQPDEAVQGHEVLAGWFVIVHRGEAKAQTADRRKLEQGVQKNKLLALSRTL